MWIPLCIAVGLERDGPLVRMLEALVIAKRIRRTTQAQLATLVAFSLTALALTGCGVDTVSLSSVQQPVSTLSIQGIAHGGSQAISNAVVQLWQVGASGYGSGATKLGSSTTTDTNGSFSLGGVGYTCASGTTQVYLTVTGGNPGLSPSTTNNPQIQLVDAIGNCSNLQSTTQLYVNEMTTVAAAYALSQYFTTTYGAASTDAFGTPGTSQSLIGIQNAMATAGNLACAISTDALCTSGANGGAITSGTINSALGNITVTPEATKLGTIANILAACVNSTGGTSGDGSSCGTLFANVAPTGGTAPTDILQAAVDMALNPTSNQSSTNIANLLALQTATSPYPDVATVNDWTVGINYALATTGTTSTLLNDAIGIAVDGSGNIWVLNYDSGAQDSVAEFSPTGTPIVNPLSGPTAPTLASLSGRNIAIDQNNNLWVASSSSSGTVFEYNTTTGATTSAVLGKSPYGIAIDGNNNVFVGEQSSSATHSVVEFPAANIANVVDFGLTSPLVEGMSLAVDTSNNVWISGESGTSNMAEMTGIDISSCTSYPCTTGSATFTPVTAAAVSTPFAIAAGPGGVIWAPNTGGSVALLTSVSAGNTYGSTVLNQPEYVAVDGAGNAWVSNKASDGLSEFSSTGVILSSNSVQGGYTHNGINGAQGIAVDPSGNVWVANDENGTKADANSIFELVGAAVPAVTPISSAIKAGKVGARP